MLGSIPSTLDIKPGGGGTGSLPLDAILGRAEASANAAARLAFYRRRLSDQATLVQALDLICGQELTPREATASERDAGKLEAVLVVALDILASPEPKGG